MAIPVCLRIKDSAAALRKHPPRELCHPEQGWTKSMRLMNRICFVPSLSFTHQSFHSEFGNISNLPPFVANGKFYTVKRCFWTSLGMEPSNYRHASMPSSPAAANMLIKVSQTMSKRFSLRGVTRSLHDAAIESKTQSVVMFRWYNMVIQSSISICVLNA